jgi:hypothetical protein
MFSELFDWELKTVAIRQAPTRKQSRTFRRNIISSNSSFKVSKPATELNNRNSAVSPYLSNETHNYSARTPHSTLVAANVSCHLQAKKYSIQNINYKMRRHALNHITRTANLVKLTRNCRSWQHSFPADISLFWWIMV